MKSPLLLAEKNIQKELKNDSKRSMFYLLELARLNFLMGEAGKMREYYHRALAERWPGPERATLFMALCSFFELLGKNDRLSFLSSFYEKKEAEFSKEDYYQILPELFPVQSVEKSEQLNQGGPSEVQHIDGGNESASPEVDDSQSNDVSPSLTLVEKREKCNEILDPAVRKNLMLLLMKHYVFEVPSTMIADFVEEIQTIALEVPMTLSERISLLHFRVIRKAPELKEKLYLEEAAELLRVIEDPLLRAKLHFIQGVLLNESDQRVPAMRAFESGLRHLEGMFPILKSELRTQLAGVYADIGLYRAGKNEIFAGLHQPNLTAESAAQLREIEFALALRTRQFEQAKSIAVLIIKSETTPIVKANILMGLAKYHLEYDAPAEALLQLNAVEGIEGYPEKYADFLSLKSTALLENNQENEALETLQKAVDLTTNSRLKIQRKLQLGRLYRKTGRVEEGVKTLKSISEVSPEAVEAEEAVTEMKELRTDLEKDKLSDVVSEKKKSALLDEIAKEIGEKTFIERLHLGLSKTRNSFVGKLETLVSKGSIDDDMLDEIEELLILADVGFETTELIVNRLRKAHKEKKVKDAAEIKPFLIQEITSILKEYEGKLSIDESLKPAIIMMIGVNGVGKTTTIAKLAYSFLQEKKSVLIAAADTFRAGAIEQISEWGRRLNVDVIKHQSGSDPSAVAYDGVHAAKSREKDVLIIDTAGRLHTQVNLMEELKKIRRIVGREHEGAPHEILLVLDATNGQNAISQAKIFKKDLDVSGIILTKLDGTSKGGIIISIVKELGIPVKFIGVGEKMYDLRPFNSQDFVEALFGLESN